MGMEARRTESSGSRLPTVMAGSDRSLREPPRRRRAVRAAPPRVVRANRGCVSACEAFPPEGRFRVRGASACGTDGLLANRGGDAPRTRARSAPGVYQTCIEV